MNVRKKLVWVSPKLRRLDATSELVTLFAPLIEARSIAPVAIYRSERVGGEHI
jgi:hypothetical protein